MHGIQADCGTTRCGEEAVADGNEAAGSGGQLWVQPRDQWRVDAEGVEVQPHPDHLLEKQELHKRESKEVEGGGEGDQKIASVKEKPSME